MTYASDSERDLEVSGQHYHAKSHILFLEVPYAPA
jgi:hypothetical protein